MSKQEYIIKMLASNETKDGVIDQSLYDFIVESVSTYFNLEAKKAKKEVTETLKQLYVVGA